MIKIKKIILNKSGCEGEIYDHDYRYLSIKTYAPTFVNIVFGVSVNVTCIVA